MFKSTKSKSFTVMIIFLTLIMLFTLCNAQVFAAEHDNDKGRLNFVSYIDANLYTERLAHEVFDELGYDLSITMMGYENCVEVVDSGIYDGIANFPELDSPNKGNNIIAIPVETARERYYPVININDRGTYSSWNDLSGKTVGILKGNNNIKASLPADIKSCVEISSYTKLYSTLTAGECDLIVIADTSGKTPQDMVIPTDKKIVGSLGNKPCYIYVNKKHSSLVNDAVKVIDRMKKDGTFEKLKMMKPTRDREEKTVFYLSSYSSEMQWEQNIRTGINNVLSKYSNIIYHNIALNSFRNTDISSTEDQMLSIISTDFIHSPPDAVIVSDNEAMQFLMNNYNALLPNDIPVAFCGLNNGSLVTPSFIRNYENIGGVGEEISASDTVDEILKLLPKTQKIFVINDYSLTGKRWKQDIENQLKEYEGKVDMVYNDDILYEDLIEQVSDFKAGTVILSGSYFLDAHHNYFPQSKLQRGLKKASSVPIFSLLDSTQGLGALGGKYANAVSQGETAANLVVDSLESSDEKIDMVEVDEANHWVFDINIMKEFGIKKSQLPAGTTILNSNPSLQESNPILFYSIIAGAAVLLFIIALLSVFTYILRKRNKKLTEADDALRNSRDEIIRVKNRLQTVIDTAPIAYSLLVDDIVIESNRYYRDNIGLVEGQENATKYKKNKRYNALMRECREKGFVENINWQVENDGEAGTRYLYNIALSQYKDKEAIVMWGVEVEELEKQKDAIARAHHDLQQVIESTPMPIALLYPAGKEFLYANPSWYELMEVPDSLHISNLQMGMFAVKSLDEMIKKAFYDDTIKSANLEFDTYEGKRFEAETFLKKVMYDGKECLVVTHKDLREEKAREQMLTNAANKEKEANRLKGHFLMNVGHEIRTPMNSIIGMTQLANPSDDSEKLYSSMEQIGKSASVLLDLINSILDVSMIEEGKMVLNPKEASLSEIIANVREVMKYEGDKKQIRRTVNLDGIIHDHIVVDTPRLEQILLALLANAIKFTPDGGSASLTVEETEEDGDLNTYLFRIEDKGIGIEPDKLSRLFKFFEQGDDSVTRKYGGMGLGLSTSKKIIEKMGGEIWVESTVDVGSVFNFTIKVPVIENEESEEPNDADTENKADDYSNLNILIVDDVDINRMILEELLSEIGVSTDTANDGQQALDKIALSKPGHYDLILMDIQMPVMDGLSATRQIKALDRTDVAALPIVAVTANALPGDVKMIMDSGMQDYLSKPVFKEQLIEIIAKYIKNPD